MGQLVQATPKQIGAVAGALSLLAAGYLLFGGNGPAGDAGRADKAMQQLRAAMIGHLEPKWQKLRDNLERQVAQLGPCHAFDAVKDYACQRPTSVESNRQKIIPWRIDQQLRKHYFQLWHMESEQYVLQVNPLDRAYVHVGVNHQPYIFEYDGRQDRLAYFTEADATRRSIDTAFFQGMPINYEVSLTVESKVHSFMTLESFPPLVQRLLDRLYGTVGYNVDLNRCRREGNGVVSRFPVGQFELSCLHRGDDARTQNLSLGVKTRNYPGSAPVPFFN